VQGSQAAASDRRTNDPVPGRQCKRSSLTRPPLWSGSGAWNGEELVLMDTVRRGLLPYSADGQARLEPRGPLSKALTDLYPMRVAARSDGHMVVQADADRFLVVDRGYAAVDNVSAHLLAAQVGPGSTLEKGSTIEKVYTWAPAGTDIVAFADVKAPGERWATGIIRLSPDKGSFEFLNNLPMDDVSRKYHRLGYGYITSLGDTAFYLLMGNGTHLWRHEKGKEPEDLGDLERAFPLWKKFPLLLSYVDPRDFETIMGTVEKSAMPTGLYGWKDPTSGQEALYLVSRQFQNGKTEWLLTQISKSGRVGGTVFIRSDANHLFAIPGPSQWAIVEKGPATGLQQQTVESIYTIPAEKVKGSFERLAGQGSRGSLDICQ
jgi:hypothetical protein